ncbi:MAG: DNA mismatch endonuclease Vsr [Ignavibacteriales bacterium]|nr:DNA mismatch endonuclease Vsr [Ignavibacteriales bacterium]
MDKISPARRSKNMQKIKSRDTVPELHIRKMIFAEGYRYRLHVKNLPGKPDIVFPKRKKIIFVNGCFWHMHNLSSCKISHVPKSRIDFWMPKLLRNVERDKTNLARLNELGYKTFVIWECEINGKNKLLARIKSFLDE